jgi:transposase
MQEINRRSADGEKPEMTVGIDLGDRFSRYCVVNQDGEVIEEGRIQTTMAALERHFTGKRQRIAMECGTHSPWVSRLLQGMGHEVLVANARKVRAITGSESKNDRNDAGKLARFAAYDVRLLSPIQHRSPERQRDLPAASARHTGQGTDHAGECDARVGEVPGNDCPSVRRNRLPGQCGRRFPRAWSRRSHRC